MIATRKATIGAAALLLSLYTPFTIDEGR